MHLHGNQMKLLYIFLIFALKQNKNKKWCDIPSQSCAYKNRIMIYIAAIIYDVQVRQFSMCETTDNYVIMISVSAYTFLTGSTSKWAQNEFRGTLDDECWNVFVVSQSWDIDYDDAVKSYDYKLERSNNTKQVSNDLYERQTEYT